MRRSLAVLALLVAAAADAAPDTSLRPEARTEAAEMVARPEAPVEVAQRMPVVRSPGAMTGVQRSVRPEARPENLRRRSVVRASGLAVITPPVPGQLRPVCGDRRIVGQGLEPIRGRQRGCGVAEPVRVSRISGLTLSQPAVMDCPTAQALLRWVDLGVRPAVGRLGGGPAGLKVAAHYVCRTRNNRAGAKISEHGRGRAIDISGIVLASGQTITVLRGWREPSQRRLWRQMHAAACGPFGTVLGPNSDRFHQDHFHFDTASYRSGSYCH